MARYIPNLRWKRGEKNALSNLSALGRSNVAPLFLVGADQFKDKKATKKIPLVPAPIVLAQEIATSWGASPFFLDASPIAGPAGQPHRLISIAQECRTHGLSMIPATRLGAPATYQSAVSSVAAIDQRGVCLRIDLQEMTSMAAWIGGWQIPLPSTDLIVDFGDQAQHVAALGPIALATTFQTLHQGTNWRTVTTVGTSMPENFTGLNQGLHTIRRYEKQIWQQLTAATLPYPLDYGDYATVTTAAPPPGIAWGYPISVKYTLPDHFLICRGVRTRGVGAQDPGPQLTGHAQSIVGYVGRNPLHHCWADDEINAIAGGASPQGLEHWVRIGVNRHIELVRSMLP
ncbi:hypothetical protein CK228_17525 [Mesorhizobium sp. WSM4312]|uniref:beta family protein n=1 Tax=Mesorhizobium sp. WSM4312 TaxID=2029411 RepID=UPI000BAF0487|nr:beta family protein [Mesorhizobium sp. WSM4312]PBB67597.1 hypothetical protein CK228_17525 [Mesorhizobium sp. WSM4312]